MVAIPNLLRVKIRWLVIDPFTTACEIRRIVEIDNAVASFAQLLAFEHSAGAAVFWIGQMAVFPEWFAADPTGVDDSALAFSRALTQLASGGTLLMAAGATYRLAGAGFTTKRQVSLLNLDARTALVRGRDLMGIRRRSHTLLIRDNV